MYDDDGDDGTKRVSYTIVEPDVGRENMRIG